MNSSWEKEKLPKQQAELATKKIEVVDTKQPLLHSRCPICKKGKLHTILLFDGRGSPTNWNELLKDKKLIMSN